MKIIDKVLNLPAWKMMLGLLLAYFVCVAVFEIVVINTVFSLMNHALTRFEQDQQDDIADMDAMDKAMAANKRHAEEMDKKVEDSFDRTMRAMNAVTYCAEYNGLKQYDENIKHRGQPDENGVEQQIAESSREEINSAIKLGLFDPADCEHKPS